MDESQLNPHFYENHREDQASQLASEHKISQDYIYFRCGAGHENYLPLPQTNSSAHFHGDEIIVQCQHCPWQSPPFKPALFQQNIAGDVLLWVYTSKDIATIQSTYNLTFPSPITFSMTPAKIPILENKLSEFSQPSSPVNPIPPPSASANLVPQAKIVNKSDATEIIASKTTPNNAMEEQSTAEQLDQQQEEQIISVLPTRVNLGDTQEMPKPHLEENTWPIDQIIDDSLDDSPENASSEPKEKIKEFPKSKTIKILPRNQKRSPLLNESATAPSSDHICHHYFPEELPLLKISPSGVSPLVRLFLVLLTICVLFFIGLQSCNEQGDKISQAIRSIQITTAPIQNSPVAYLPTLPTTTPGTHEAQQTIDAMTAQQKILLQRYEDMQKEMAAQQEICNQLQEKNKAMAVSYANAQRDKQDIQSRLEKLNQDLSQSQTELQRLLTSYQSIQQAIVREFEIAQLDKSDQDMQEPILNNSGRYMLFYQETISSNTAQTQLYLAELQDNGMKISSIFKTSPVVLSKKGIPFSYSWDGLQNIVIRVRIEGKSSLYHLRIQLAPGKSPEILQLREVTSVQYPEVIGPPQISPDGKKYAVIHKIGTNLSIKVYSFDDGLVGLETIGGGDSDRVATWSPDNDKLYFLTNERTGIVEWNLATKGKRIKQLNKEIYGRYLTMSPSGKKVAFFLPTDQGNGQVHLYFWNVEKDELVLLQQNMQTVENYHPAWSAESRFLAAIHKGEQSQIAIYDTITTQKYDVVQKTGKINWLDWSCPQMILFSYQEGLYNRPYWVQFVSWFARH